MTGSIIYLNPSLSGQESEMEPLTNVNRHCFKWAAILTGFLFLMGWSEPALAYIGPGAGFAFLYSFLVVFLVILIAPLFFLVWPLWYVVHRIRTGGGPKNPRTGRVVILGMDGLDPELCDRFMVEGKMPNFQRLADEGCYHRLGTTIPSVSPVAWSTFQTGVNPAKHNIFDFLSRDLKTCAPVLSSSAIGGNPRCWKIGGLRIPRGKQVVRLLRKSKPFWKVLGENGVFSTILRVPITFPPEKFYGLSISGMCAPDLKGTQGTFTCYSTGEADKEHTGGVRIPVKWNSDTIETYIPGPVDSLSNPPRELRVPLTIQRGNDSVILRLNGRRIKLRAAEYSEWIKIVFKAGPGMKASGIARFYLSKLAPDLVLYMSPVNIDPEKPSLPVSHPLFFSAYLAKLQGSYATLGLAEDTWALNEGVIDDRAFLEQTWLNHEEREQMFFHALKMNRKGLVVCVFDTSDRIQHMFWRYMEPDHPANKADVPALDFDPVEDMYIRMDDLLWRTREKIGADDVLMVISDHGFKSFRRCFSVNAWLKENGYLRLKEGTEGGDFFRDVDWSRTKAYGVGLGGFFINLKGREAMGIVQPGEEYDALKRELKAKLTGLVDADTGETAINRMYDIDEIGGGPYAVNGPDLLFGFNPGCRISWDSVTGDPGGPVFSDNVKKWSGDHAIDADLVPGVFFSNKAIDADNPHLRDLGATTLDLLGVEPPAYIEGRPLMKGEDNHHSMDSLRESSHDEK